MGEILLPNQEGIRIFEENEHYKYLGIVEVNTTLQAEMREKNNKRVLPTNVKLLKTKFCRRNLIKEINIWAVSLVKY